MILLRLGQSEPVKAPWPVKRVNVTDPKVAEAEPLTADQFLIQAKGIGSTDLLFWSAQEDVWRARVDVEMDLRRLKEQLISLFPGCTLDLFQNQGVVVVRGTLRRAEDSIALRQFLDALKTSLGKDSKFEYVDATRISGVQQVLLQVRVAEANRAVLRSLGINVFNYGKQDNVFFGASTVGPATGGNINNVQMGPASSALVGDEAVPVPFLTNENVSISNFVTMNLGFPRAELQFLIQALAENQYVRLLAEPNLVAQSGEEATFLAGGEFPIPVVQGTTTGGGTSITIEYKEFGIQLKFRPVVLGDSLIRLKVEPEVSELTEVGAVEIQGFRVPALTTRRASTTLEMHSGQTFSMAGLISKSTNATASRVPGIGDMPVLGALFRSVRYREGETELVVLCTVSLVEPMSLASLPPLPGATHSRPNDWELYLGGKIEGSEPPCLSEQDTEWLKRLGFEDLQGPGAWSEYGERPPENTTTLRPQTRAPTTEVVLRPDGTAP
ncbi:MAG TPA: pilus assembly protein N-terminal domain-containing protein [Phycisphaerae bacterium]|nr:pilus assembly protein N-terminal domain-containing protein [Phycisphaerae bacterium]